MSKVEPLGIKKIEALHYYVHDLERSRRFYTEKLDFAEIAEGSPELTARGRQRSAIFQAGECAIIVSAPVGEGGRAWRYLQKHPDGVGTIIFEVEDADRAFKLLDGRGGTPLSEVETYVSSKGKLRTFSITTPFGSTTFRFVERAGYEELMPGVVYHDKPRGGTNAFGFQRYDHITANFETMAPALLWLEHVLGFEEYWRVQFHTHDVRQEDNSGSGLRSRVMWDPGSGVKFANNEPMRPFFTKSQINIFYEQQRGDGVQHVALAVKDILRVVRGLRERGVGFMSTPGAYYDRLPERIEESGIAKIDEDIGVLRELEILVDGKKTHQYLLQIFLEDSADTHDDSKAGPFFFEIIQRKGDHGFGEGNFRALFESIESKQQSQE